MDQTDLKRAVLWHNDAEGKVVCDLCQFRCTISDGKVGHCRVRKNISGVLYSLVYSCVCASNADPVEKKPLFHFQPGSESFSISTPGCNFRCIFCQNWQISQVDLEKGFTHGNAIAPEKIVEAAIKNDCKSIAYTYTEPTIFMELCADCGLIARQKGLKNIFVSNGYMTPEAVDFAEPWLDAINIDLKSFSDDYYKRLCKARLAPVLDTIRYIAKKTNIWLELTTLIIPGQNDSDEELTSIAEFICNEAGADIPWHVSRFYPCYQMDHTPATSPETLERAYNIGKKAGLRYIYIGNLPSASAENTYCPSCKNLLIERRGYNIVAYKIKEGQCPACSQTIAGVEL